MKKLLILLITSSVIIISSCANKKCADNTAVNFEREGECLYCKNTVETETITIPVTNLITYSPLYGQEIAELTLERRFSYFVGNGCGLDYDWRQTPACVINMKLKNTSNKKFKSYEFIVKYSLNDTFGTNTISGQDTLKPNQETAFKNFSTAINGNLKNAKITVTATHLFLIN